MNAANKSHAPLAGESRPPFTPAQKEGLAAGDERMFRDLFEKCARRFHDFNVTQGAAQHRQWQFANCPAESCKSARQALGMRVNPLGDKPGPVSAPREPGEEG